jgi:hypothetical protein
MLTSEILDKAADHIERVGWAKDDWYIEPLIVSDDGADWSDCKLCAGGGINVAAGYDADFDEHAGLADGHPAARAFMVLAERVAPDEEVADPDDAVTVVIKWNDADERTAEEVVRELRAAAASEREAGR